MSFLPHVPCTCDAPAPVRPREGGGRCCDLAPDHTGGKENHDIGKYLTASYSQSAILLNFTHPITLIQNYSPLPPHENGGFRCRPHGNHKQTTAQRSSRPVSRMLMPTGPENMEGTLAECTVFKHMCTTQIVCTVHPFLPIPQLCLTRTTLSHPGRSTLVLGALERQVGMN